MMTANELTSIADYFMMRAKEKGATQSEISVSCEKGFSVHVRMGKPEHVIYHHDRAIELTVHFGHRQGNVSLNETHAAALDQAIEKACRIAQYTDEDPCSGLADADRMATYFPDLDLYHPHQMTVQEALEKARDCETEGLSMDKRLVNSEGAFFETSENFELYANSHGFIHVEPSTYSSMGLTLIAKEGEDMQRDSDYTAAMSLSDLADTKTVAHSTAKRAINRLHARRLETMKAPVIFIAEEAKGLFSSLLNALSGGSLYRQSSFLLDSLGQSIFPNFMHIYEDPYIPRAVGSAAYDDEGVQTQRKDIIKDGIVQSYLLGSYSARQMGLKTTANAGGVHNLRVSSHALSLADLLKKMQRGLLVTELMGQGVNIVTGDYSRGAFGFWVDHGAIQYPVSEVTVAGRLQDMFKNIVAISNDTDIRGNIHTGSVLITEMMIAGA